RHNFLGTFRLFKIATDGLKVSVQLFIGIGFNMKDNATDICCYCFVHWTGFLDVWLVIIGSSFWLVQLRLLDRSRYFPAFLEIRYHLWSVHNIFWEVRFLILPIYISISLLILDG